ncbi:S8 family peptidase [Salinibacter ruber]|uniref:S8 family peptidase n=1 Tax=Salinibacter ruber TaxID=146919 RepID=UPI00216A5228|nr:hypothetical protein [Salinibacter ruber]MCS4085831.1 hypothetical protein [Salinibacter ruber]
MEEADRLNHLEIEREPDWEYERRKRSMGGGAPSPTRPDDREEHGNQVESQLDSAADNVRDDRQEAGVIPDRLMVLEFNSTGIMSDKVHDVLERLGAYVVDEEQRRDDEQRTHYRYVVQFSDQEALQAFKDEIECYRIEEEETTDLPHGMRRDFVDSLNSIRLLDPEDRIGPRLSNEGFPEDEEFFLDIDLWRPQEREDTLQIRQNIRRICRERGGRITDTVSTESLLLLRAKVGEETARTLLDLDVVARADLPPRVDASLNGVFDTTNTPTELPEPDPDAPFVCVVDSGINPGHPFLRGWVADSHDFGTGEETPSDQNGHGTEVAGIAAYGNLREYLEGKDWNPAVKLLNAKVLRDGPGGNPVFPDDERVEGVIAEAIEYFCNQWDCRVFNLSLGDPENVYTGGRQFQWAEKLDEIARDLDVVIVVSAVNRTDPPFPEGNTRDELRDSMKEILLEEDQRVCSPATASLSVTVGAISRSGAVLAEDGETSVTDSISVVPEGGPSPFTRTGPGYSLQTQKPAIKPDFVHFGGNYALQTLAGTNERWNKISYLLGEPTTILEDSGRFLGTAKGTSIAAPHISHIAAVSASAAEDLIGEKPSANLTRALLGSTAACPSCEADWFEDEDEMLSLVGYGRCYKDEVQYSAPNRVHVIASDEIELDQLHVYKIPLPDAFLSERGERGITVSLAYDPPVRSSRKEYLARTMQFELLHGLTNSEVARYRAAQDDEDEPSLPNRNRLDLRPRKTKVQWSTLQVRRKEWVQRPTIRANNEEGSPILHLMVLCQERFETPLEPSTQSYSVAVKFWHEDLSVDIHQKIRSEARVTQRARERERVQV